MTKKRIPVPFSFSFVGAFFGTYHKFPVRILIGGDFNCASAEKDKKGGKPVSKKSLAIKEIEQIMHLNNLIDKYRNLNQHMECFTSRSKFLKIQCRLNNLIDI